MLLAPRSSLDSLGLLLPLMFLLVLAMDASPSRAESTPTWTTARGNAGATGAVDGRLPDDLVVIWERQLAEAIETTPVSDGQRVYVTDVMGGIEALNLTDGGSVWRKDLDTGFVAAPAIFMPADYATAQNLRSEPLPTIQAETAQAETGQAAPNDQPSFDQPILVVGDVEGNVYAFRAVDGELLWKQTTDGEINGSPSFFRLESKTDDSDADGNSKRIEIRVLQTSQDGSLYCFDLATGTLAWKYETGDQIRCAVSIGDGKTYLGGCDAGLHVVNLATGKAAREPLPLEGPTGSTPAISGNEVFVPIMDGILYSFDPESGSVRWQYEDPDRPQDYRGSVAIGPDRVVIASRNKHVEAIERSTGKMLWRTTLRRRADASPLIVGDDVWIASTDGQLLRLGLSDGSQRWSYEIKGGFYAAPAILGDRLVIADDEGVVRCFGPKP
ncbi:outer membrane protein assembly factor BamB family protein [Neorhodopirellula pilleata]|uniref:Outer membrane protein assembly factor BamB n=1 Tax=Neorhodopirellula pilleata TaxID=2714738 RepID=A0A5C6AZN1_9BACT|nr:PQQ-binding-like beta-propeller repeat protein [Neorhodopirellula pilleata]TWU03574.1 Outer membrane protein assembly factor BamB precursor [Neorhodopirellula pilleata]